MRSSRITLVFASFHGNTTAEQQLVQQFKGKVNLPEKEIGKNDVDWSLQRKKKQKLVREEEE